MAPEVSLIELFNTSEDGIPKRSRVDIGMERENDTNRILTAVRRACAEMCGVSTEEARKKKSNKNFIITRKKNVNTIKKYTNK